MRPVLAALLPPLLFALADLPHRACAQEPLRRYPELLPFLSSPEPAKSETGTRLAEDESLFTRPVGSPDRSYVQSDYTWTLVTDPMQPRRLDSELSHMAPAAAPMPSARPRPSPLPTALEQEPAQEAPELLKTSADDSAPAILPQLRTAGFDESMIAPPARRDPIPALELAQVPPPPESLTKQPVASSPSFTDPDTIGSDPFVQEACGEPFVTSTNRNHRSSENCPPGGCNAFCQQPEICGILEPYANLEFRPGNRRVIGAGGFFIPLWQDCESVLFTDLKGRGDDHGAADGFFGLGYRVFLDPNWILGTYVYYDLRVSDQHNFFNQANVGIELLSLNWEFRVNGYLPGSDDKSAHVASGYSDGTLITRNFRERAYRGIDWEIGYRFLYWGWNDRFEARCFIGSYSFDHSDDSFPSFAGPRSRWEMRIHDLGWLGNQSRFEFGMEVMTDRIRHEQIFGYARVNIPLGGKDGKRAFLDPLRRRMLDAPVRPIN